MNSGATRRLAGIAQYRALPSPSVRAPSARTREAWFGLPPAYSPEPLVFQQGKPSQTARRGPQPLPLRKDLRVNNAGANESGSLDGRKRVVKNFCISLARLFPYSTRFDILQERGSGTNLVAYRLARHLSLRAPQRLESPGDEPGLLFCLQVKARTVYPGLRWVPEPSVCSSIRFFRAAPVLPRPHRCGTVWSRPCPMSGSGDGLRCRRWSLSSRSRG